ncbi:MAG: hypothetical protein KC680_04190 [Candidatus Peregrinibacteria bacterium]|nr:hypothetical protein [Candidatus Peregrinibacteria bacterium]MCB9808566.1 hypothetical protein [Candidatus Peribacteria bacterium]
MKRLSLLSLALLLAACGNSTMSPYPSDATQSEINMAVMMGISVEELRSQTPEEHMKMMIEMQQQ